MDQGLIISVEGIALVCCSEEKVEPKGKVLDLLVHLHSNHLHLSWGIDHNEKNTIPDTSGWNELSSLRRWEQP